MSNTTALPLFLAAASLLAACSHDLESTPLPCKVAADCPSGQVCASGRCVVGDAAVAPEASADLRPDQVLAEAAVPDAPKPDQATADLALPDAPAPDQAAADLALPDAPTPDQPLPDASKPDAPKPDQAVPDTTSPDTGGPLPDPKGFPIYSSSVNEQWPRVASNGKEYLVVWRSWTGKGDIRGARVTTTAGAQGSFGISTLATSDQSYPDVAYSGPNYMVVWEHKVNASFQIWGARVDATGWVMDSMPGVLISGTTTSHAQPAVACSAKECLVAWQQHNNTTGHDVQGRRFDPNKGTLIDTVDQKFGVAAESQQMPDVAFDGTNYIVTWQSHLKNGTDDIWGTRFTPKGSNLHPKGVALSKTGGNNKNSPKVACIGQKCLVVWRQSLPPSGSGAQVMGLALDTSAGMIPVGTKDFKLSGTSTQAWFPAVAANGTEFLALWRQGKSPGERVYGHRVTVAGGLAGSAVPLSKTNYRQLRPAAGSVGQQFLTVWQDHRMGVFDIYGARYQP